MVLPLAKRAMLLLKQATYIHPNKDILFEELDFLVQDQEKVALIGQNGIGKSSLLKILAGQITLNKGDYLANSTPYYIPQLHESIPNQTVADVLGLSKKLQALDAILAGELDPTWYDLLNDDWTIEERSMQAFQYWQLEDIRLKDSFHKLSGGQKTKVFLAGIQIFDPDIILMDEPSNHLDQEGRELLYQWVASTSKSIVLVSHDRNLLNLFPHVAAMSAKGITHFGGNYDFYEEQKTIQRNALDQQLQASQKELRKAKEKERESLERQQKLNARGKGKQEKSGLSRIMMNTLKNNAENSSAKLKGIHQEKILGIQQQVQDLRNNALHLDQMQFDFKRSHLAIGKVILEGKDIQYQIRAKNLWRNALNFQIKQGSRWEIAGRNGSGKTTLIKLLLQQVQASSGSLFSREFSSLYIDQDYSIIQSKLSIYEMAQSFNDAGLAEHEIKIRLNRFLFPRDTWNKPCEVLSGGERMRLLLCSMSIAQQAPDLIILDEPSNNIDIQNMDILTNALNQFEGTIVLVSHDAYFKNTLGISETLLLQ
ncbi:ABC-F family ATP-binding cassette domain-containing protein [Sphingobacterium sp. HJSM2_6]|uniref:ABC-F family ATP-binding cassette domain-containing protein n=1 Tax=Sphingobacterium sp. HJSM2_6 TaxID=3366264 RepID=UPI003BE47C42